MLAGLSKTPPDQQDFCADIYRFKELIFRLHYAQYALALIIIDKMTNYYLVKVHISQFN